MQDVVSPNVMWDGLLLASNRQVVFMKKSVKNFDSVAPDSDLSESEKKDKSPKKTTTRRLKTSSDKTSTAPKNARRKKNVSATASGDQAESAELVEGASDSVSKSRKTASGVSSVRLKGTVKKDSVQRNSSPKRPGKLKRNVLEESSGRFELDSSETSLSEENAFDASSFDMAEIRARIEGTPLSDRELARRESNEKMKARYQTRGVESVYSGPLPKWEPGWLVVQGARQHNLKSIDVPFPLSAFSVVTGVSGSGKSSLVEDVLFTTLTRLLNHSMIPNKSCDGIWGAEQIRNVVHVDQSPIGQTPTSNPATYTGLFDLIRSLYAQLPEAKVRGYSPRQFSFNVPGGRCEKCEGSGFIKVEMHFLADVWIVCDACGGKRYDAETLQVKYHGKSISDTLETTCGDALRLFSQSPAIKRILRTLCDVGLDYLPLGQSATTLSGGEAQRVKLAAELSRIDSGHTLYVLDEPTTGLHFEDVSRLLDVLHRLVDLGNTVVVVEHNLDVVKNADWILDIGPEPGLEGGNLVFAGTPEQLLEYVVRRNSSPQLQKRMARSYTGEALFPVFERGVFYERPTLDVKQYWDSVKEATEESQALVVSSDSEFTLSPWEIDGRRWHTELRTARNGAQCHWDSRILSSIVDRLTESSSSLSVNWGSRSLVEVGASGRNGAWFIRAVTNDEWLLKLRFRTAKNSFNRDLLARKLALKPLNDMDEIPLYGTQPRVRVETVGAWQEIELRVFSFDEIDQPEFWNFLDLASERFNRQIAESKENEPDLTPWKTKGREWHLSLSGFYGASSTPKWSFGLLEGILDVVQNTDPFGTVDWRQKINVRFIIAKSDVCWAQVFTKNVDFICVQVNVKKNSIPTRLILQLGFEPQIDSENPKYDVVYLRFRTQDDFNEERLRDFMAKALKVRAS